MVKGHGHEVIIFLIYTINAFNAFNMLTGDNAVCEQLISVRLLSKQVAVLLQRGHAMLHVCEYLVSISIVQNVERYLI